ncbi:MAG: glutamate--tRNA ligase [Patescibacteria group bacterium]|nr:glutamate--tRNA ligase [Patescibacteria group bacterium]
MNIVTRFAPSPTGLFHAGSYRTALFAYIYARQNDGTFILRIEDTDRERSKKEYEENIVESLAWLGLKYDQFFRQSDRTALYQKYVQKLIGSGHAYVSKETPKEPGGRNEVIRFKNPRKKVTFHDLVRGTIEFDTSELGDFVIAKSLTEPVFHLVNVVDDFEMGITHVIRGEDHISNTPRQILIYEAIGATRLPEFAHIPLLLASDRSKLSKRHGALPMTDYRARGYIPDALVNYMALLGWHPSDDREIMPLDTIIKEFSLERVQKSGAVFDEEKLRWFNRQYISEMSNAAFAASAAPFLPEWLSASSPRFNRLIPILREKIAILSQIGDLLGTGGELGFVRELPAYQPELLLWKKNPSRQAAHAHLSKALPILSSVADADFGKNTVKDALWDYAEREGRGDVLWPIRVALTGQAQSPDPFIAAEILGRQESLTRLAAAIKKLS